MIIRVASLKDMEEICDLSNEINNMHCERMPIDFKPPDSRMRDAPHWKTYIDDSDGIIYVAEYEGKVVGAICAKCILNTIVPFIYHRKKCHIGTIVVSNKHIRTGIGKLLMKKIENFAKEQGCEEICLEVMKFNIEAQQFYFSLGYDELSIKMRKNI
ncbi:hypothetical acetyltransferase [Teredinibacter turnerae T7901]|uniref:Hypothetical acetyltransferase n=1 Tax=Teredinibacter turnerae (strain ATCC 39867 / T7901) TaxID=377629 RepID=C5BHT3_TERTT|nr:GNAT family N-acetyltransferase [Teredinibacter turnerae]ACR14562.1 hypothetical acetyltransferase [Teredinibacter turnerae T7901]